MDGVDGIRKDLAQLRSKFPAIRAEVKRIVAEGDLVVVHLHGRMQTDDPGLATIDVFRLEEGKLVEHWEVRQAVTESALHQNSML